MDSGATAIAATCSIQATAATAKPTVHQRERKRAVRLRSGLRSLMSGASQAPRCLKSIETFAIAAHASASAMPRVVIGYRIGKSRRRLESPPASPDVSVGEGSRERVLTRFQAAGITAALG